MSWQGNFSRGSFLKKLWREVNALLLPSSPAQAAGTTTPNTTTTTASSAAATAKPTTPNANAGTSAKQELLLVVFLRGGWDSLNIVVPLEGNDRKIYEQERPNIKMPIESLLPLNPNAERKFGLHPKAKALHDLFLQKKMAIIAAVGLQLDTRSHFDAQNFIELGNPANKNTDSGWLARLLQATHPHAQSTDMTALSMSALLPTSLSNESSAISINDVDRLNLAGPKNLQVDQQNVLTSLYQQTGVWWKDSADTALLSLQKLQSLDTHSLKSADAFPKTDLGRKLKTLTQLLSAGLAPNVVNVDMGGWDTHKYQGVGTDGTLAKQVEQLSEALGVFYAELAQLPDTSASPRPKVTTLVMSEFGRRVRENANRGTDHGHGCCYFVIGDDIKGGQIYGEWPGLATEKLYDRADLAITTDFRQVLAEIAEQKFKISSLHNVLPGYNPQKKPLRFI